MLTVKGLLVILGGGAAGLGGLLLLFLEWDTPELLSSAKSYVEQVKVYLAERDELLRLDEKRRALLDMQTDIYEACETLPKSTPVERVVKAILDIGSVNINAAIGFEAGEVWAFSIFRKTGKGRAQKMERIAVHWADREGEGREARDWKKKEGFTGWAWHDATDVIVDDARNAEHGGKYDASDDKRHDSDKDRYVSAAAIPILIGKSNVVWGVVTATSNASGRFKRNPSDIKSQNVDTVRVLARLIATQVALRK
ncbi:GAF domain-containing protein [Pseudoblastomonas halimionae]|uniref:GAF domain-containing protein n=1 Tax=Alteriqipengyuania halimionae TaxID=1926630 RepID=A0A6I4U7B1_9SPHN|nr:GAF domain-containing protein [Alteriqipengyuania halimionae]MXP10763.1 hypothetical protein [Alteriqipengyuania halimionae]